MVTCKEAHALIAHAVDGRIALAVFEPLRQHLAVCASCREALDTQRRVKAALAARPSESLPDGFAARLAARLDAEPRPHLTGVEPAAPVNPSRLAAAAADVAAADARRARDPRDARRRRARRRASDSHPAERHPHLVVPHIAEARSAHDEPSRGRERELVREMTLLATPLPSPERGGWRDSAAWRTWSLRLLPIAAALLLVVGHDRIDELLRSGDSRDVPISASNGARPSAAPDDSVLEWLARPSTTVDSLLVLGAKGARNEDAPAPLALASARAGYRAPADTSSSAAGSGATIASAPAPSSPATFAARDGADAHQPVDSRQADAGRAAAPSPNVKAAEDAARFAHALPAATPVAAGGGTLPGTVVPNAVPTALAGRMAQDLRLTDEQRKKIEAIYDAQRQRLGEILEENRQRLTLERAETDEAVERVLTPRQRKRYRDMNANRGPALPVNERALPPSTMTPGTPGSTPPALPNGLEITITPADPQRPPFMR